jgi:hypothetical protein
MAGALVDNPRVDEYATPEEAVSSSMPPGITHVVETLMSVDGQSAYVLLAVEVAGTGFYLDGNVTYREPDGSWAGDDSVGGGFTDRTLAELRADPPPPRLGGEWDMSSRQKE